MQFSCNICPNTVACAFLHYAIYTERGALNESSRWIPKNFIIIYTTEDGLTKIDTTFDGDTVWLSIDQMADLFQRDKSTISRHIKNIFAEGEQPMTMQDWANHLEGIFPVHLASQAEVWAGGTGEAPQGKIRKFQTAPLPTGERSSHSGCTEIF